MPSAAMLAAEAKNRRGKGDEVYIYVNRSNVLKVLEQSGTLDVFGQEHIIH